MKPKPILVVKATAKNNEIGVKANEIFKPTLERMTNEMLDYHILPVIMVDREQSKDFDITFECLYPDKLNTKDFEEFKNKTLNELNIL